MAARVDPAGNRDPGINNTTTCFTYGDFLGESANHKCRLRHLLILSIGLTHGEVYPCFIRLLTSVTFSSIWSGISPFVYSRTAVNPGFKDSCDVIILLSLAK